MPLLTRQDLRSVNMLAMLTRNSGMKQGSIVSSNFKQIMRFRRTITLTLVSTLLALSGVTVVAQSQAKPADRTRPRITVSPTPKTPPANEIEIDKLLATGQD